MALSPIMSAEEVTTFLDREFPQIRRDGRVYEVGEIGQGFAELILTPGEAHLRPGGTVSGPSLFSLADLAAYVAVLSHIGPVALAVTTNLNINFLRKPEPVPLVGLGRILKLGKRLAVIDVGIAAVGESNLVAHATATYSIPPR